MRKVFLPSAISVSSELQNVGKIPAIVYPIDQKDMISLFKEQYLVPGGADSLEIVTYEAHEKVAKRVGQTEDIHLWKMDTKRDIGYTVWWGLSHAGVEDGDAIVINFADVIVFETITGRWEDRCYYAEESISSKWTFFKDDQGRITEIYDKLEDVRYIESNNIFIGIFCLAHPRFFLNILEQVLENVHGGGTALL